MKKQEGGGEGEEDMSSGGEEESLNTENQQHLPKPVTTSLVGSTSSRPVTPSESHSEGIHTCVPLSYNNNTIIAQSTHPNVIIISHH